MKKNNIFIALILVSLLNVANAALPTGATPFDVNIPSLAGGATFGITALHWETSTPEYDYALVYPLDIDGFIVTDSGTYRIVEPDSRWNFKLSVGFIFPCSGSDLTLNYLNYHQHTTAQVGVNPFNEIILPSLSDQWPTTGVVFITDPLLDGSTLLAVTANPNLAEAKTTINHAVFDVAYGQYINVGSQTRIKYYGGIRYASLRHDLLALYSFNHLDPTPITIVNPITDETITVNSLADFNESVKQDSRFEGIGPQLGANAEYYLCWGFGLVGELSSSLLVGKTSSSLEERFTHTTAAIVVGSDIAGIPIGREYSNTVFEGANLELNNGQQVVPNIDARVGLNWSYQYCNPARSKLTIEAGYMVSQYFNVIDRLSEVAFDQPELRANHRINNHFEGFYVTLQVNT